jgi:hypothetical protein
MTPPTKALCWVRKFHTVCLSVVPCSTRPVCQGLWEPQLKASKVAQEHPPLPRRVCAGQEAGEPGALSSPVM